MTETAAENKDRNVKRHFFPSLLPVNECVLVCVRASRALQSGEKTRTNTETSAASHYYLDDGLSKHSLHSVQQIKEKLKLWKMSLIYFAFST